jgi:hypothetical protein
MNKFAFTSEPSNSKFTAMLPAMLALTILEVHLYKQNTIPNLRWLLHMTSLTLWANWRQIRKLGFLSLAALLLRTKWRYLFKLVLLPVKI